MTLGVDLSLVSLLDLATRSILLLISILVFVEFLLVRAQRMDRDCIPLLHAILVVVGTTALSVAYYLVIQAAPADLYVMLLDWGFIVQVPRLWAMLYLLRVLRGRAH